jgi:hypothetical protein
MSVLKFGLITGVSALGLFAAAPAHAHEHDYSYKPTTIMRPIRYYGAPYTAYWYRGRWARRPVYVQPGYQYSPVYSYDQPSYQQQPRYGNGCNVFAERVRAELANIEATVRARVAAGQLDGNALTAMESARDDINEDIVDVSAKGYLTDADRAHIENDVRMLHQKFGY